MDPFRSIQMECDTQSGKSSGDRKRRHSMCSSTSSTLEIIGCVGLSAISEVIEFTLNQEREVVTARATTAVGKILELLDLVSGEFGHYSLDGARTLKRSKTLVGPVIR